MMEKVHIWLLCALLLTWPASIGGGPFCYGTCVTAITAASALGGALVLPALGFTSSGIAAGSWAAAWMASFGGAVPAGSLFATLQAAGASGMSWNAVLATAGGVSNMCMALCAPLP